MLRFILTRLNDDESGATLIEYSLISALIAIAAIAVMTQLGSSISGIFSAINVPLAAATAP